MSPHPKAWLVIASLEQAMKYGEGNLREVPGLLKKLLKHEMWREFTTPLGKVVTHDRFDSFLATPPMEGLGVSYDLVRRIVAEDLEAVDLLDSAVQAKRGGDQSKDDNVTFAPNGNAQDQALRKLRKDRPDLHAEVIAGRISAHAAMVNAGFRHRTATIRCDDPQAAVRTLLKHYTAEQLAQALEAAR